MRRVLARFPGTWNHVAEKISHQVNTLDRSFIAETISTRLNLL
jgi:hypothetical protein